MDELKSLGIGTSIYYPHPVPYMSYYKEKYQEIECPNAELISNSIIAMPVGPHLKNEDKSRIVESFGQVIAKFS
jgi:perosamine synthetase